MSLHLTWPSLWPSFLLSLPHLNHLDGLSLLSINMKSMNTACRDLLHLALPISQGSVYSTFPLTLLFHPDWLPAAPAWQQSTCFPSTQNTPQHYPCLTYLSNLSSVVRFSAKPSLGSRQWRQVLCGLGSQRSTQHSARWFHLTDSRLPIRLKKQEQVAAYFCSPCHPVLVQGKYMTDSY